MTILIYCEVMIENIPRNFNCQRLPAFSMKATLAGGGYHIFEVTLLHTSIVCM